MPPPPHSYHHPMQVGRDPRLSSPLLAASISAGLASRGAAVGRFGLW